jgi:hypothetical protein
MVGRVPEIGRCPDPEKCRGRGRGAGAEDGEFWAERVRNGAIFYHVVHMGARVWEKKRPCGDAWPGMEGAMGNGCQRSRVRTDGSGTHANRADGAHLCR